MRFHKYQALGNDYLVLGPESLEVGGADTPELFAARVRTLCDRHLGVGADGVLVEVPGVAPTDEPGARLDSHSSVSAALFWVRIFNPDGSEAEKSGNGLRIFARYLWDEGRVGGDSFQVVTVGGTVRCRVLDSGRMVFVEMGTASFDSRLIPVAGPAREVVAETLEVEGTRLEFTAVTVGNPHCVVHLDDVSPAEARRLGPVIERHPLFPNRTNVQFVRVVDRHRLSMEIWERGAGYTLASGSSSCAAAAASVRRGFCDPGEVHVGMPGGTLAIGVSEDFALTMLGPVEKVASGTGAAALPIGR